MALATYCNFACIYGCSPVGLDNGDRELDRIDPKLRSVLQDIAWDAVTSHPMSGVTKDGRGLVATSDAAVRPAATGKTPEGRPGDLRLVFGLFDDAGKTVPAALAMVPSWNAPGAHPVTYGSPVGKTSLAHVALATQVRLAHRLDADGKGLTLAAAIPRSVLPSETPDWSEGLRTTINFDANFGSNRKIWWANADGSASRETNDEPTEARLYPGAWGPLELAPLSRGLYVRQWQVIGPFGFGKLPQLDVRSGRGQICVTLADLKFPPELQGDARDGGSAAGLVRRDLSGRYEGDMA